MIWYALHQTSREVVAQAEGFCNCSDNARKAFPDADIHGSVAPYFLTTDKDFWQKK
jgi:hypothetical protein